MEGENPVSDHSAASSDGPLTAFKTSPVGKGRYMETEAILSRSGKCIVNTRVWTTRYLMGFTGAVEIRLKDRSGHVLERELWTKGVDGRLIFWESSDDPGPWSFSIPANLLPEVEEIEIRQYHARKPRWQDILKILVIATTAAAAVSGSLKVIYDHWLR